MLLVVFSAVIAIPVTLLEARVAIRSGSGGAMSPSGSAVVRNPRSPGSAPRIVSSLRSAPRPVVRSQPSRETSSRPSREAGSWPSRSVRHSEPAVSTPRVRQSGIRSYDYLTRDARRNGILSYDYLTQGPRHRYVIRHHTWPRVIIHRPIIHDYYYYPHYYRPYPYFFGGVYIYGQVPPVIINQVEVSQPERVYDSVDSVVIYASRQEKLIDTVLRGGAIDRQEAARSLAEYKDLSSVAVLIDVLINDGDNEVRAAAAQTLAEIADPSAYEALLRSAAAEQEEVVRLAAQNAAEHIKNKTGEEPLYVSPKMPPMNEGKPDLGQYLEDLRYGPADIRENAAGELDNYKGTQTVAALIDVLINDPEEEVRKEAAQSLADIGDRMAIPFLKWSRYNDTDKSVRKDAEKALEKIYHTIQ